MYTFSHHLINISSVGNNLVHVKCVVLLENLRDFETIMTTRLTGGLNRSYKPRLQVSASRRWLSLCSSLIAFDSSLAS